MRCDSSARRVAKKHNLKAPNPKINPQPQPHRDRGGGGGVGATIYRGPLFVMRGGWVGVAGSFLGFFDPDGRILRYLRGYLSPFGEMPVFTRSMVITAVDNSSSEQELLDLLVDPRP